MNKKLIEWWHSHRIGNPYAMLVLMSLVLDADRAGRGTISQRRLARDANLSQGDVIDCIIYLEKQKLVKADIDERGVITFELNLKKWGARRK